MSSAHVVGSDSYHFSFISLFIKPSFVLYETFVNLITFYKIVYLKMETLLFAISIEVFIEGCDIKSTANDVQPTQKQLYELNVLIFQRFSSFSTLLT